MKAVHYEYEFKFTSFDHLVRIWDAFLFASICHKIQMCVSEGNNPTFDMVELLWSSTLFAPDLIPHYFNNSALLTFSC